MFKSIRLRGTVFVVALVAACAVLAGAVYFINQNAVERLLTREAEAVSTSTAHYFEKYLPNLESILTGAAPNAQSKAFIARALIDNGVERFKLFDAAGVWILDSQGADDEREGPHGQKIGDRNDGAVEVLGTNRPIVALEIEQAEGGEELIAETYVPVVRDGKTIGVAEVYADLTGKAAMFRETFNWTSWLIALVTALGFAIPALALHRRTTQNESLHFLANHDSLTTLPNRAHFNENLVRNLGQVKRRNLATFGGQRATLSFIDLDFFKEINDRHGHAFGDKVLRVISARLRESLRAGDLIARFGGDEFVVAQFGCTSDEQTMAATNRIARAFKEPLVIDGREITVTASIGTAVSPQHGVTAEQLIKNADTAVYVVKARGRNDHCYFEPKFDEEKRKRIAVEAIVRGAVASNGFELNFQPHYGFKGSRLKGFEALLRLQDADGRPVSPADFIPVAEQIGLIDEIGSWVLETACMTAASWNNDLQISVNLSVAQFKRRSVVRSTKAALAKSGIAPERLLLEITESLLMTDTDAILDQLRELKQLGVAIVMDDFGTGYSSLGYMLKFPFDRIKIDRSFVTELENGNENASTVVQTIIAVGHTLDIDVTAEGVETAAQSEILQQMNCDDAQGYYYGRPMPASAIPALLTATYGGAAAAEAAADAAWRKLSAA